MSPDFDVIVVGGGPGGAAAALYANRRDFDVLLLEKEEFPRDKVCGDGISGKSAKILDELGLTEEVEDNPHSQMNGVIFSSPNGETVEIEVPEGGREPPGYVSRREVFDNILFQRAKEKATETIENFQVTDLLYDDDGQVIGVEGLNKNTGEKEEYTANVTIGADGAVSVVAQKLGFKNNDPEHNIVAIRTYYRGVKDMKDKIELHFVDEMVPGYFWIFPLEDDLANVGMGMVMEAFQERHKGKQLDDMMFEIIEENDRFSRRFEDAEQVSDVKGWNLPVGSALRRCASDGALTIGDAAGLIDPLSGEGIGNALVSAKMAAEIIDEAYDKDDFSYDVLEKYEERVHRELGSELQLSYKVQRLGRHKWLLNWFMGKASEKPEAREAISMSLLKPEAKEVFTSPLFYLKMLV